MVRRKPKTGIIKLKSAAHNIVAGHRILQLRP